MRIVTSLTSSAALVVVALGVMSAPADASTSCATGAVCMWEDPNYKGEKYVDQPGYIGSYEIDGWDGDNEISSVKNNTDYCVRLYANDGFSGATYFIQQASWRANLEQNGFDNQAESYKIYSC